MELYRDYPRLCTVWCFVEILFYAGQIFGWSSIFFVLKREGFYAELCTHSTDGNISYKAEIFHPYNYANNSVNYSIHKNLDSSSNIIDNKETSENDSYQTSYYDSGENNDGLAEQRLEHYQPGCHEQDARLNLWFSVAICTSYMMCSVMGPILQKVGLRCFRILLMCSYIIGALCLGFATPDTSWLVCPGLCCIGVSGMALFASNIHVSYLFPTVQSTITAVFVGLYDASTVVSYLMKVAADGGIARKYFYIGLVIFHVLLVGTNTFLFMPCIRIKPRLTRKRGDNSEKTKIDNSHEKEKFIQKSEEDRRASYKTLLSCEYLLHVYWMCVQALRFVTFLGFFNSWLETKVHGNKRKESYYLGVFSYVTMATAITAITAGMLHDCQRRKFMMKDDFRRRRLPIILPLTVTSLLSVVTTSLTYVDMEIFLNIVFVLFTIYRSYLFSFEVTFINDLYPLTSFPVLFGVLHSSAGLSNMLQYPLFGWYQAYPRAPSHVNIFMLCLAVSSLAHPLYLWYRCKTHRSKPGERTLDTEIYI